MICARCVRPIRGRQGGRGLCKDCHRTCSRNGSLLDFPRATRSAAEVQEDYAVACLRMPDATIAERAELMGMSAEALRRALERARARARANASVTELRPPTAILEPAERMSA